MLSIGGTFDNVIVMYNNASNAGGGLMIEKFENNVNFSLPLVFYNPIIRFVFKILYFHQLII